MRRRNLTSETRRRRALVAAVFAIAGSAFVGPPSALAQTPCAAPSPPTAVAATVSGTFVVLTWTPPAGKPLDYAVEAGSSPGTSNISVSEVVHPATEFTASAPPGTYYVRVRARNACGLGQPSREIVVVVGIYQDRAEILVTPRTPSRNTYFPSVVKLGDGRLFVAYYDSPEHVSPLGRISMVQSRDDGRTWSPPRVVVDTPLDDRDPSLAITRTGRLLLSYFALDNSTAKSAGVFVARSDDGATWSEPVRVETVLDDVATSSKIIETANGDLLIPLYGSSNGGVNSRVTMGRSRDGGLTWPRREEVEIAAVPGISVMEPALAAAGARMLVLMRTDRSDNWAYAAQSLDSGATWSEPSPFGIAAQASELVPLPGEPPMTVAHVWADWSHHWGDSRPTVAQLIRWPAGTATPVFGEPKALYNSNCDDTGYPSGVVLDDGRLFVVFYDACHGYIGGAYLKPGAIR